MVPNRATHHHFGITSTYEIISYQIQDTRKRKTNWKNTRRKWMSLKKKDIKAKLKPRVSKYLYFKYNFFLVLIPKTIGINKANFSKQNLLRLHVTRKVLQLPFFLDLLVIIWRFIFAFFLRLLVKAKRFAITFLFVLFSAFLCLLLSQKGLQ